MTRKHFLSLIIFICLGGLLLAQEEQFSFQEIPSNYNLIKNSSFESWSKGVNNKAPDAWVISNISIARDNTNKSVGLYCAKLGYKSGASSVIYQDIQDYAYYKGKKLTFGCSVKSSVSGQVKILLDDGVTTPTEASNTGSSSYQSLSVTKTIDPNADKVRIAINVVSPGPTPYIDASYLYEIITDTTFIPTNQDELKIPSNLIYTDYTDLANQFVGIANPNPKVRLDISGPLRTSGAWTTAPTVGVGLELYYDNTSSFGLIQAYDRANSTLKNLYLQNQQFLFSPEGNLEVLGDIKATGSILSGNNLVLTQSYADTFYLKQSDAENTYLTQNDAADDYLTTADASTTYVKKAGDTITGDLIVDGKVGIGTASPSQKLDVNGDIEVGKAGDGEIYGINGIQGLGSVSTGWYSDTSNLAARIPGTTGYFGVQDSGGNNTFLTVGKENTYINGNVGIGTTTPGAKLDISKPSGDEADLLRLTREEDRSWNINVSGGFILKDHDNVCLYIKNETGNVGIGTTEPTQKFQVNDTATSAFVVTSAGLIGIGTTSPQQKLHINESGNNFLRMSTEDIDNYYSQIEFADKTAEGKIAVEGDIRYSYYDHYMRFLVNGAEQLRINSSGNVGIGTTDPEDYKLNVNGSINAADFLRSGTSLVSSQWTTSGSNIYYNSGNVGIGTNNPKYQFTIRDTVNPSRLSVGEDDDTQGDIGWDITNKLLFLSTASYNYPIRIGDNWMYFKTDGNVGIGAASPHRKLTVIGNLSSAYSVADDSDVGLSALSEYNLLFSSYGNTGSYKPLRIATGGSDRITVLADGSVGIGTTEPSEKLEVNGAVKATKFFKGEKEITESQWTTSGSNIYYNFGNVGIGITDPQNKLHIDGGGRLIKVEGGNTYIQGIDFYNTKSEINQSWVIGGAGGEAGWGVANGNWIIRDDKNNKTPFEIEPGTGNDAALFIKGDGNVGIGTTDPSEKLEVDGTIKATRFFKGEKEITESQWTTSSSNIYYNSGNVGIGTTNPSDKLTVGGAARTATAANLRLHDTDDYQDGQGNTGRLISAIDFRMDDADWKGNSAARIATVSESTWANDIGLAFYTGTGGTMNERVRINANGNVGIGTAAPGFLYSGRELTVSSSGAGTIAGLVVAGNVTSGSGSVSGLSFFNGTTNRIADVLATRDGADNSGALVLQTTNAGSVTERLRITSSGNVGIGTTVPQYKLHVNGSIQIDNGNINAKYQDVAEWVGSEEILTPGTVVVIDPDSVNKVIASNSAYDSKVCGVVSYQPGLSLGEKGENKYQIAHSGRVKVKADASFGKISQGDLLTTSPKQGYAMKYNAKDYRPGVILGKALEALEDKEGEILILLSLQ